MRRLLIPFLLLAFAVLACTLNFQTIPEARQTQTSTPATETVPSESTQDLEGPEINYKGIHLTLDPSLGSHLYAFDETLTIDTATAPYTRLAANSEEACQTWCILVYPVAEFEKFGGVVFPPAGYRGGAAVVVKAQEKPLAFQNGSGDRSLETFGQNQYGVSNESLKYVFRGYTVDKQYAVYVQIPVRTASLPDVEPTATTNSDPVQDILQYNQQATQTLSTLTPADFTPNLDVLDALVESMQLSAP